MILYNTVLRENRPVLIKEKKIDFMVSCISSPETVHQICRDVLRITDYTEEYAYVFGLNGRSRLLGIFEVSHGITDAAMIRPKEIMMKLLLMGACQFLLVHNHPSQEPDPSGEDLRVTRRLCDAGRLLGLDLLDHIVVTREDYYSMREHKRYMFEEEK